jgi:hypothetical protein
MRLLFGSHISAAIDYQILKVPQAKRLRRNLALRAVANRIEPVVLPACFGTCQQVIEEQFIFEQETHSEEKKYVRSNASKVDISLVAGKAGRGSSPSATGEQQVRSNTRPSYFGPGCVRFCYLLNTFPNY